jgi:Arc/MetJ-type ribon-helix-helix transcriptional regulator
MTQLKPHHEQLVQEAINSGRYQSVDEFLDEALSAWKGGEAQRYDLQKARAAAASIRELRKGLTLGELKMKDLVAEGRR